ncbi:hypothetical protein [Paenibacillus gallinarum]|uniref:Secreted protein n=1 Tax=Paenibacillus gallinarum TaxID=2762232 RepID=A0ABR8T148_9BACL|nr:hypothetical protein [Paenibacillus gallinarum]MBD7969029.1 hypothetical protein [Paenibacillus gallinarum]
MNDKVSNWVMSSSFAMMLTIGMAVSTSPYASSGQPASNTEKSQHSTIDNRSLAGRQQNMAVTRQETDRLDHSNKQNNK